MHASLFGKTRLIDFLCWVGKSWLTSSPKGSVNMAKVDRSYLFLISHLLV